MGWWENIILACRNFWDKVDLNQNAMLTLQTKKIMGKSNFSEQVRKLINRYKRIGYNLDIMWQTASLVVNPITVDIYAFHFNCTAVVRASDSVMAST